MKFPNPPRKGEPTRKDYDDLLRWLRANNVVGIAGGRVVTSPNGKTLIPRLSVSGSGSGQQAASAPCYFGEIITYSETEGSGSAETQKTGIRGGYLEAGKKIWNVPNREINLEADGEFMIYIKVRVTANMDTAHSVTLSGLDTSEEPTWEHVGGSDDYPDKTIPKIFPTTEPGKGIAIIPIGKLTIANGAASLLPTGCGNLVVDHCPGVLTHHRGPVTVTDSTSGP